MSLDAQMEAYFKAWNAHDAAQVAALFETNGRYEDPISRMAVRSFDIEAIMASIVAVFPDFQFEVLSKTATKERGVAEWILIGTNSQPLKPGIDATGRPLHLRGIEIFEGSSGFTRVTRYFDQKATYEQIGMQVIVEPFAQAKAVYGYSNGLLPAIAMCPPFSG